MRALDRVQRFALVAFVVLAASHRLEQNPHVGSADDDRAERLVTAEEANLGLVGALRSGSLKAR